MEKIVIKNFGPIEYFESEIKKFNILIGPQASGKSTIVKSIYFMTRVKKIVLKMIDNLKTKDDITHFIRNLNKQIRKDFVEAFGTTRHMKKFELIYYFKNENFIKVYLDNERWVKVYYSQSFIEMINDLKKDYFQILINLNEKLFENPFIEDYRREKVLILTKIYKYIGNFFDDIYGLLFVPAGRSMLSILGDNILEVKNRIDIFLKEYVEEISNIKEFFNLSIEDLIKNRKKLYSDKIDFYRVEIAKDIIKNILRGEYIYDREEKIYFDENRYVKLNLASSGQQESLWILNIIFIYLLFNRNMSLIFEEPEAHLFPTAQRDMVNLIAIYGNIGKNKVFVTTHSPYILSSFNNLIYAGNLYEKNLKVPFIKKEVAIKFCDVNAYMIKNGKSYSILDEDIKQIKAEEIDSVSNILNKEYEKLLALEFSNEFE